MRRTDIIRLFGVVVLLMALQACGGYRVAGRAAGADSGGIGVLPGNVRSIAIPFFINNTKKPNVEGVITNAVAMEFMTSIEIVDENDADALLIGVIKSYELEAVSFTATDVIQGYRLHVDISITLVSSGTKEVLWKDASITDYEDFVVDVNDISASKDAETEAFKIISFDMARLVKERMLEGF